MDAFGLHIGVVTTSTSRSKMPVYTNFGNAKWTFKVIFACLAWCVTTLSRSIFQHILEIKKYGILYWKCRLNWFMRKYFNIPKMTNFSFNWKSVLQGNFLSSKKTFWSQQTHCSYSASVWSYCSIKHGHEGLALQADARHSLEEHKQHSKVIFKRSNHWFWSDYLSRWAARLKRLHAAGTLASDRWGSR